MENFKSSNDVCRDLLYFQICFLAESCNLCAGSLRRKITEADTKFVYSIALRSNVRR